MQLEESSIYSRVSPEFYSKTSSDKEEIKSLLEEEKINPKTAVESVKNKVIPNSRTIGTSLSRTSAQDLIALEKLSQNLNSHVRGLAQSEKVQPRHRSNTVIASTASESPKLTPKRTLSLRKIVKGFTKTESSLIQTKLNIIEQKLNNPEMIIENTAKEYKKLKEKCKKEIAKDPEILNKIRALFESKIQELPVILASPVAKKYFSSFLTHAHAIENLNFFDVIEKFKKNPQKKLADDIVKQFIALNDMPTINILSETVNEILDKIKLNQYEVNLFDNAQKEVFELMRTDSINKFLKHPLFSNLKKELRLEN